jgi:transposase
MPLKKRNLASDERLRAVFMAEQGQSHRSIARTLKINRKTVDAIVSKHRETGSVADLQRTGRRRKSTSRQDRVLVRSSLSNRRLTAADLRHSWNESCQIDASTSTIKRRLSDVGLRGCVAVIL